MRAVLFAVAMAAWLTVIGPAMIWSVQSATATQAAARGMPASLVAVPGPEPAGLQLWVAATRADNALSTWALMELYRGWAEVTGGEFTARSPFEGTAFHEEAMRR